MRTRRDQVQAYRFVIRRLVSAMLSGEPEATERPMRRLGWSVFASAMVTVLVSAVVGIWGMVTAQGSDLSDPSLVVDGDTRARYVYVDGTLHPVRNLASARLILGGADFEEREVSASTLEGVPRGNIAGIPGAPDGPPTTEQLVGTPWRVCNIPPSDAAGSPRTVVVAGQDMPGGEPVDDAGLFVADDEQEYFVWRDRLLPIDHNGVKVVLGISAAEPTELATPMRNALATGPGLDALHPEGFEEGLSDRGPISGENTAIGYLYEIDGQHYMMVREGLVPVGEFYFAIRTRGIGQAKIRDIRGREVTTHLASREPFEPAGFPLEIPDVHRASSDAPTICVVYRGPVEEDRPAAEVEVFTEPPDALTGPTIELLQTERDTVPTATELALPSGAGALVQEATLRGAAGSGDTIYLLTPEGVKYPLGGPDEQEALGYGDVEPTPVPAELLSLVPTGVPLTADEARAVVDTGQDGEQQALP